MESIDRRQALKRISALVGGALSAPTLAGILSGCRAEKGESWSPSALNEHQNELVIRISQHIIPETDTPGAKGARVNRYVDKVLGDSFLPKDRKRFLSGLNEIDPRSREAHGSPFLERTFEEQRALLTEMDEQTFENEDDVPTGASWGSFGEKPGDDPDPPSFFRTMKELTLVGYYTSEVGAKKELRYSATMGRYEACVPYEQIGRSWA